MTAEVGEVSRIHLGVSRYGHINFEVADADEGHCFVARAFHEELDLRVLIGSAKRGNWSRSDMLLRIGDDLAQTLRP